jgi:hypothetical protein
MKKNFLFPVFLAIATLSCAQNQEIFSKWSLGTSITYPLQNIYMLQVNYRPSHNHEFFIGPCFQNFGHESFKVNAYTLLLGYRYYIWKGLHVESEVYPAYNNIYSKITQTRFPGFEMWAEIKIGYQINLFKNRFFIQPAPGIGFGIFQTNKPPNFDQEINYPVFTPQIIIGARL